MRYAKSPPKAPESAPAHRQTISGKAGSLKNRVKVGAVCIGIALAAYLVFCLVQLAAVGYWPTLTGAV